MCGVVQPQMSMQWGCIAIGAGRAVWAAQAASGAGIKQGWRSMFR